MAPSNKESNNKNEKNKCSSYSKKPLFKFSEYYIIHWNAYNGQSLHSTKYSQSISNRKWKSLNCLFEPLF